MRTLHVNADNSFLIFQVLTEPRQMDAPIEQWIEIVESKEKKRRADVGMYVFRSPSEN